MRDWCNAAAATRPAFIEFLIQKNSRACLRSQSKRRENIMHDQRNAAADSTAVRVALWRAMHVQVDPPPHVLEDEMGLKLAAPDDGWRRRPDMDPHATRLFRASIVARARFIEDRSEERRVGKERRSRG